MLIHYTTNNLGSSSKPISAVPLLRTQAWDAPFLIRNLFFLGRRRQVRTSSNFLLHRNFLVCLRGSLLSIFPARSDHSGGRAAPGGGTPGLVSGPGHLHAEQCAATQREEKLRFPGLPLCGRLLIGCYLGWAMDITSIFELKRHTFRRPRCVDIFDECSCFGTIFFL